VSFFELAFPICFDARAAYRLYFIAFQLATSAGHTVSAILAIILLIANDTRTNQYMSAFRDEAGELLGNNSIIGSKVLSAR
jgi:hypothetical protein